jgi:uncharacterized membrane protein
MWKPNKVDLGLSVGITLGLPFIAYFLYAQLGALLPMLLYYGLAWGITKWRRGSTGYFNKFPARIPPFFYINVGVIFLCLVCAYFAQIIDPNPNLKGILVTALIWAPVNAATEQLLWIYIFEAWDLYPQKPKSSFRFMGLLLFSAFVGLIHVMFWVSFLHTVDSTKIFGIFFVVLTSISGFFHLVVWRQSNQMIFTFIPHFLLNLVPLFWTAYSILPYL